MKIIQMQPIQWAAVADNPIQRNTEEHAKKAVRGHLSASSSAQAVVHAAVLPNGKMIKLDGHTRSLLWADGRLAAPATVQVVLHEVKSMKEAMDLYKHFDNPGSTENATDRLSGAYRLHGIVPKNRLLTHGGITSAFHLIDHHRHIYEMVGEWKTELTLLDELEAANSAMPSTLICAALLTLRKHGPRALDFWRLYAVGGGTRVDGKSCGVDELCRIVADLRARKQLATGSSPARTNQAGRAISCCDKWLQGRLYAGSAKTTDLRSYLDGLKGKKAAAIA